MIPLALVLAGGAAFLYFMGRIFEAVDRNLVPCLSFDEHADQALAVVNGFTEADEAWLRGLA